LEESSRAKSLKWPYPRCGDFEGMLRDAATAWFKAKGFPVSDRQPYILAQWEDWPSNIILPEVARYIQDERDKRRGRGEGFPLHRYIHHGLSSQAMMFNLLGPLVLQRDFTPLMRVLADCGIEWPEGGITAKFEFDDRRVFHEDTGQPTSIDLVISGDGLPRLFLEGKLVERRFGGCSVQERGDCDGVNPAHAFSLCYLHYLGRTYWQLLDQRGFLSGSMLHDRTCFLAAHYQFFREALFAFQLGGSFILITDERNPAFCAVGPGGERGVLLLLLSLVPSSLRDSIGHITIQQLASAIKASARHDWIEDFNRKYRLGGESQ